MTLDLLALGASLRDFGSLAGSDWQQAPDRVARMRELLQRESAEWEFWRAELVEGGADAPMLVACPCEPLDAAYPVPVCPSSYSVAASDGSHLDVEYHGLTACYLINVGTATIRYGVDSSYAAASKPTLRYLPHDLVIDDPETGREFAVEGQVLAAQRDLYEGLGLAMLALELPDDVPRLALQDGTLIRWSVQGFDPVLQRRFIGDYLSYLETMASLPCPVASYMSRPRTSDVVNLARCLLVRNNWNRWRSDYGRRATDPFVGIPDHVLYAALLSEGERSPIFESRSRVNVDFYGPHLIHFFYLKVGSEVARVEFPRWVLERGEVALLHALVYDQCGRGIGYPAVLQRAHEQAVIHDDDRRHLQTMVHQHLARASILPLASAKTATKLRPRA
ncbi:MAG: DNA double-strand break repair nuclease NurA [Herpetosiphon sp.]